jgi:competence protein ComGC
MAQSTHMNKFTISIIDVLVGLAILMILAVLFIPHFIPPSQKAQASAPARSGAVARPAR